MKRLATLLIAAGLLLGAASGAKAIDFKAKGEWIFGFGAVESTFEKSPGSQGNDVFKAQQRVRLQLEAVASESLSGVVYFEIGDQNWGRGNQGGALGADGVTVEVKRAYIDWVVPNSELSLRMGIQGFTYPNAAGGSAIMDDDAAGITASYKINDMASVTAFWMRPLNDNYPLNGAYGGRRWDGSTRDPANYVDNMDVFGLAIPLNFDGVKVTPWGAYSAVGKNSFGAEDFAGRIGNTQSLSLAWGMVPQDLAVNPGAVERNWKRGEAYGDVFFVGLPIAITAWDPLNIEIDLNYGYSSGFGNYNAWKRSPDGHENQGPRADSRRAGWLAKALFEYKMDWGVPGIFGWYGSGDDDDVRNGSERMPSISPCGNFTSFMGDGVRGWSISGGYDRGLAYDGSWGIGLRLRDMSFMENLTHTFTAAYYGGTNSTSMIKYMAMGGANPMRTAAQAGYSPYLTTADSLVEFTLDNVYKVYENLNAVVELGYIINGYDKDEWRKSGYNQNFDKADGYKAALIMQYAF